MNVKKSIFGLCILVCLFISCGDEESDAEAPRAPTGLELRADSDGILLTWSANYEDDLAGYHIYRHRSSLQKRSDPDSNIQQTRGTHKISKIYRNTGRGDCLKLNVSILVFPLDIPVLEV